MHALVARISEPHSKPLSDLSKLLGHVKASNVLVILQSAEVLHRPWCLIEMYTAIKHQVPIIAITGDSRLCRWYRAPCQADTCLLHLRTTTVAGKDYDFSTASNFLMNLDTMLEEANPGACAMLNAEGVDLVDAAYQLSSVLPRIISVPFNPSASSNYINAALLDIVSATEVAVPAVVATRLDGWLVARKGISRAAATAKPQQQHGDLLAPGSAEADGAANENPAAAAPAAPALAHIPLAVPDLPPVTSDRSNLLAELRGHVLGIDAAGSVVSVSSTKRSGGAKVAAHGQGGVGKTTVYCSLSSHRVYNTKLTFVFHLPQIAIMLVNDVSVRSTFTRIGWVSVGQSPEIMVMQQELYQQLTGAPMEITDASTTDSQLALLHAACAGQRWLLVLDDVWDKAHEQMLNCVDSNSASKALVTTRTRGLLPGCGEVSLSLMSEKEAVELLLRTGGVEATDAARAAALEVALLCGRLPLYLGILGAIIQAYDSDDAWLTELPVRQLPLNTQ